MRPLNTAEAELSESAQSLRVRVLARLYPEQIYIFNAIERVGTVKLR